MRCGSHEGMQEGLLLPKQTPGQPPSTKTGTRRRFAAKINALGTFFLLSHKQRGGQNTDSGGGSMSMGRLLYIASVLLRNQYQRLYDSHPSKYFSHMQIARFEISLYITEFVTY